MSRRSAQFDTATRVDVDEGATCSRSLPNATTSLIAEKNFSLFSTYLGGKRLPSASLPTSFARSMMRRCP